MVELIKLISKRGLLRSYQLLKNIDKLRFDNPLQFIIIFKFAPNCHYVARGSRNEVANRCSFLLQHLGAGS